MIREQAQSGLTKKAFCRKHRISEATFYAWLKRRGKASAVPVLAEVQAPAGVQAAVEVLLPNGARIGICHHGARDDLIALVRGVAGC